MSANEDPTSAPPPDAPLDESEAETATVAGSVLESLMAKGRIRSALQLDVKGAGAAGEAASEAPEKRDVMGRYQMLGEIARGGVGVVLKGRDPDLGRDVAVKVLRDEHLENDSVLQRFIEEAQIGAQMQHPGIVPVYEMGLADGDRPFFSMKLVKGRTLAADLSARDSLEDGRRRLVSVFEAVCATVAYAHARGVVHRDLKPSNVMIGSHGQILVVDWGLAKVRGRGGVADEREARRAQQPKTIIATVRSETAGSESMVGSVMGTPGYMPPEQARGDVDQMDERSDVFALGAILCEILTGSPPYLGKDMELIMMAARAELDGARRRLAECGADAPLVNLALRCLSPLPADRPRDAREVHAALRAHEGRIAARAQEARRAAAEAAIRAEEARRARRMTNILVASVLGAVVVLGGAGLSYATARASRLAEVQEQVSVASAEAAELQGRAASTHDVADWAAARRAAQRALDIATAGDADGETLDGAAALVREVEAAERAALAEDAAARRNEELLRRLDTIRLAAWDLDPGALDAAYTEAFGDYGVSLDARALSETAARVGESPIAARIASGLVAWAAAREAAGADVAALSALVEAVDTDPWHRRLREAVELAELRELAEAADVEERPVESVGRLVAELAEAGDVASAVSLGERALRTHPDDPWLRSQLAIRLLDLPVPMTRAAAQHGAVLTSLRPGSASAWANRAHVLQSAGRSMEALVAAERAIELDPENALALTQLARVRVALGDPEAAERDVRSALDLDENLALAHIELARLLADRGVRDDARMHLERALELEPNSARAHTEFSRQLRRVGDIHGAVEALERALEIDPAYLDARERLAELFLAVCDDEKAAQHIELVLGARPTSISHLVLLAQARDRLGEFEASRDAYDAALRLAPTSAPLLLVAARVRKELGEYEDALRLLSRAMIHGGSSLSDGEIEIANVERAMIRRLPDARREDPLDTLETRLGGLVNRPTLSPRQRALVHELRSFCEQRKGQFVYSVDHLARARDSATSELWRADLTEAIERARRLKDLGWNDEVVPTEGAIERGEVEPTSAEMAMDCAHYCNRTSHFASAARYCEIAFELDPALADDLDAANRMLAAWCAVLASEGFGNVPEGQDERDRRRLRRRALDWLRDELFAWRTRFEADPAREWGDTLTWVVAIMEDADFATVRSRSALERLPDSERNAFERLWQDIGRLRRDAVARLYEELARGEDALPFLESAVARSLYVDIAVRVSDLIASLKGRPFGSEQLIGPPTSTFASTWDSTWCPATENAGEEWIELGYDEDVVPESIEIHETAGAGIVTRVQVRAPDGAWQTLWEGQPTSAIPHRVFKPRLRRVDFPTSEVRVVLDTLRLRGKPYIDCVELVGSGRRQWASSARASSSPPGE